jgi:hypothetical protein
LLGSRFEPAAQSHRTEEILHDEFACEGQDNGVESDKCHIPGPFAILVGGVFRCSGRVGDLVGEVDEVPDWIGDGGVNGVEEEKDVEEDKRDDPGVLNRISFPALDESSNFSTLGEGLLAFPFYLRLLSFLSAFMPFCPLLTPPSLKTSVAIGLTFASSGIADLTSSVMKAGAPVSPALISPPNPLDFRLYLVFPPWSTPFEVGTGLPLSFMGSFGKGSVPDMFAALLCSVLLVRIVRLRWKGA